MKRPAEPTDTTERKVPRKVLTAATKEKSYYWLSIPGFHRSVVIGAQPHSQENASELVSIEGINHFIDLRQDKEVERFNYHEKVKSMGAHVTRIKVRDMSITSDDIVRTEVNKVLQDIRKGTVFFIHCRGGHGRAGTFAGAILALFDPERGFWDIMKTLRDDHATRTVKPHSATPQHAQQGQQIIRMVGSWKVPRPIAFYSEKGDPYVYLSNYYDKDDGKISVPSFQGKLFAENLFQSRGFVYEGASPETLQYARIIAEVHRPHFAWILSNGLKSTRRLNIRSPWVAHLESGDVALTKLISDAKAASVTIDPNWNHRKESVMRDVVRLKFEQNPTLAVKLCNTTGELWEWAGNRDLHWGIGPSGEGKNMLGRILQDTREQLREQLKGRT